jgi:hypothetical protein
VDVVLDYLWGQPAATVLTALITGRADRGRPLTWIEIGSVAGQVAPIPSAALRAARLQLVGSGQGSVATRSILAELPGLAQEISKGTFGIDARAIPLANVEQAWTDDAQTRQRLVITPAARLPGCPHSVTRAMNAATLVMVRAIFSSRVSRSGGRPPRPTTAFLPRTYREQARSPQM